MQLLRPIVKLLAGMVFISIFGCDSSTYSGKFEVRSDFPKPIRIKEWTDFGRAQPGRGNIGRGGPAGTVFPRLQAVPDSTTVIWTVEGNAEENRQTIDLRNVIPIGATGKTVFEFDKNGVWSVHFEPDKSN